MSKTYGQFCGLARALDHVGDRWTLLVVRELLAGPATYGDLLAALEGAPTNLLADRLRQLQADGMVVCSRDDRDRRRMIYRLTPLGQGLEPAVLALIRWGTHWMLEGPGPDRFAPQWALLALRALLAGRRATRSGTTEVRLGDERLLVTAASGDDTRRDAQDVVPGTVRVERGGAGGADAVVEGDPAVLLAVASGQITLREARRRGLKVRGDASLARTLLEAPMSSS